MKKIKKYFGFIAVAAAFLCLVMLLSNLQYLSHSPFDSQRTFEVPNFAAYSQSGKTLVIEKNKTCVTVLDSDMNVISVIDGGNRKEDSFYYAEFAAICDDIVYVVDMQHTTSGSKVKTERIQKFALDGEFLGTLVSYTYDENLPRYYGHIAALAVENGKVFYLYNDSEGLSLFELVDGKPVLNRMLDKIENDDISHSASYNAEADTITFTTKKGAVYTEKGGKAVRVDKADNVSVLWEAVNDGNGNIFVTDIKANTLIRLKDEKAYLDSSSSEIGGIYYRVTYLGGKIATTNNSEVFLLDADGNVTFCSDTVNIGASLRKAVILSWVYAAVVALAAACIIILFIIMAAKSGQNKSTKFALLIGLAVLVTASVVSAFIISNYQKRMDEKTMGAITQTCNSISQTSGKTFGDSFERINNLDDYLNEDFVSTKAYLDSFCEGYYNSGSNAYYLLYKPSADGVLYGIIEYENSFGTVYPISEFDGSGYDVAYKTGETITVPGEVDAYGKWSFVIAPVYNSSNEIVGVLEVGTNTYNDELVSRDTIKQIIITTLAAIVILLLLITEVASVADSASKYRLQKHAGNKSTVLEFVRPLILLVFMADGLDGAFLPQLSERLFKVSGIKFLSEGFAAALPMSLALLAIAVSALVSGFLIDKFKVKRVLLAGSFLQMVSLGLSAFAVSTESYVMFALLKLLGGFGMGACIVSCNSLPLCEKRDEQRSKLFSGMNIGMMSGIVLGASIGSYVAQHIGYIYIYIAAAALLVIAIAVICAFIRKNTEPEHTEEEKQKTKVSDALKYLFKPRVFTFFICAMLPFMIMLYFKEFMFPLFSDSLGYSESDIGNVILFCGMLSIWLGDVLTEQFNKIFGAKRSIIIAFVLYAAALLLFALFETYIVAIIAVVIICIASSFGISSEMMYYSQLSSQYKINEGTSMGVYSLFDNLGQTLGAPIFGALLVLGFSGAAFSIAIAAIVLILIFSLVSIKRKGDKA